jgi:hypothetical protein
MFPEAEEAADHTVEHRLLHPPTTTQPPAQSPCPPTPTLPQTPIHSKHPIFKGLMLPCHEVLTHPADPDLLRYATDGCPVDCGDSWSRQRIEAAIAKNAHASAKVLSSTWHMRVQTQTNGINHSTEEHARVILFTANSCSIH